MERNFNRTSSREKPAKSLAKVKAVLLARKPLAFDAGHQSAPDSLVNHLPARASVNWKIPLYSRITNEGLLFSENGHLAKRTHRLLDCLCFRNGSAVNSFEYDLGSITNRRRTACIIGFSWLLWWILFPKHGGISPARFQFSMPLLRYAHKASRLQKAFVIWKLHRDLPNASSLIFVSKCEFKSLSRSLAVCCSSAAWLQCLIDRWSSCLVRRPMTDCQDRRARVSVVLRAVRRFRSPSLSSRWVTAVSSARGDLFTRSFAFRKRAKRVRSAARAAVFLVRTHAS